MKKYLLKSLLLLVALLGGASAWADTGSAIVKATYISGTDADADKSFGEIAAGEAVYCGYNKISGGAVALGNKGWGVNNIAYLQVDASAIEGTITGATLGVDCQQISARGLNYGVGYNTSEWSNSLTWNTADRTITTMGSVVNGSKTTADKHIDFDIKDAFKGDADKIVTILVYQTAAGGGYIKNPTVTIEYTNAATANYTVKFMCGEVEVKDAITRVGVVGEKAALEEGDDAAVTKDGQKYIYTSNNANEVTIAEDGSTIVIVNFREAEIYNYKLLNNFGSTVASGTGFEGDNATVGYPRYALIDGSFYEAAKNNNQYTQTIALTDNDASATVNYTAKEGVNVIFYSEAENIDGMTAATNDNIPIRASNATAAISTDDVTITTLSAGKYIFHAGIFTSKSGYSSLAVNFGIGSRTFTAAFTSVNLNEIASTEYVIPEGTAIKYLASSSANTQFDYIWIEKTGEPTAEELAAAEAAEALAAAKAALQAAIDAIPADLTIYTEASVEAVNTAKAAAEAELANAEATVESLTTAKTNLETAIKGLKKFIALPEGDLYIWSAGAENGGQAVASDGQSVGLANAGNVTIRLNGAKDFSTHTVTITLDKEINASDTIAVTAYRNKNAADKKSGIKAKFDKGGEVSTATGLEFVNIDTSDASAGDSNRGTEPNTIKLVVPAEAAGSTTITMTRAETGTNLFITKFEIIKNAAEENFEPVDCTAKVDANGWKSDMGSVGNYKKDVDQKEQYLTNTTTLGQVLYQTVEGLDNGTYTVELYANASYTSGRGFTSAALNNEVGRAIVYAGDVEKTIPVVHQTAVGENNIVTLENVVVSDGTLKMGLRKDIEGSNWHTIQIKALTQTSDKAKADAAAQDEYWKGIAATVAAYEAYVNVAGAEKAAIAAAETKAAAQAAIAPFYAAKDSYDKLAQAIADAEAASIDVTEAKAVQASAETTAEKAAEAYHAVKLAINTKAVEGASASNPIVTNFVVNGTFDTAGVIAPWKTTGGFQNQTTATNQQGAFTVPFFENWNGSAKANKMYQEIEDIPNGNYTLKIAAFVNNFDATAQYVFANADHVALTSGEPTAYEVNTIVTNNKIEIGLEQTAAVANWMGIDNVSLVYTGETNIEELVAAYNEALTAAKAVEGKMNATEKAALDAAIAAEVDKTNAKALGEATVALQEATSAAKASVAAYAAAADKLAKMKALTEETNVYTAEALEEYYGQWVAKYEAETLTTAEANALQDPNAGTGWHAAITVDNFLLSAWDTNPDFVDAPYYINTWSTEGNNDGSEFKGPFFEYWTGDGNSLGEKTLTATMSNLEAGDYDVTAWVRVRIKNGAEAPATGITFQANDGEAANASDGAQVGTSQFYLKEVAAKGTVAEDGVLKIKFIVAADNNISWLSFKNVKFEKHVEMISGTIDFQELCMKLGKGGPWAVNDGGDAGFTVGEAQMHYLGDYAEQGEEFVWGKRFAYEYVADRGKFTMRNKNNKKDGNCGMFSWDFAHNFSILGLKNGDMVTITTLAGTTTFVSTNVTETVEAGATVESNKAYTIKAAEGETTRLDINMAKSTLISKIVIEPAGMEIVPTISLDRQTLALIPGATQKLVATIDPASAVAQWKSSNEAVATVAEDGTVTAVAAGTADITYTWKSATSDNTVEAKTVVTVADVDLSKLNVTTIDFTTMGDVTLELNSEAAGAIWNEANSKTNNVYYCTNAGLERIAVQAVATAANGKGWLITEAGLYMGSGAGRCAAIGGIKTGEIVEFIYTGANFYTKSDDDGIEKVALNEGTGRAIYQASEDGMIGFELVKGNAISKINIYSNSKAYEFVASEWQAGDAGRISPENVKVDAEANTITVDKTGQNNVALIFRSANTYTVKAEQRYFVIKGTGLSTAEGANYLWWLNNTNNGSQIAPTATYEENGKTVFAWDCAIIAIGGQLGIQDTEFTDQGGWSTTFGLTLADEAVPAVISYIGFETSIPEPVQEYEYEFVASEWPAGDPGRISASNVTVDEVANTITVNATGDNNVALNFKSDKVYYITKPVKYFVIKATGLSTEEGKSYLWWLNAKNNGGQVAPTSIGVENGVTVFAWDITTDATFASGFNAEGKSYLDGKGASTWGWTTTFGMTLADANVPAVISYIGYLPADAEIPTGINAVKADFENGSVYNLNGQKVQKAQKGLYIINGKKVVVK